MHNIPNLFYFGTTLYMLQTVIPSIIKSLKILHTASGMSYSFCDCLLASSHHNLYDIYLLLCVQCQTPDDGQRNCPKLQSSIPNINFEKLVHLVGFIIRINLSRRHNYVPNHSTGIYCHSGVQYRSVAQLAYLQRM